MLTRPALVAFGRELRAARRHARLSMPELAYRAGITRQWLFKIERGDNVKLDTIVLLAHALGCQVSDFFPHKSPWN